MLAHQFSLFIGSFQRRLKTISERSAVASWKYPAVKSMLNNFSVVCCFRSNHRSSSSKRFQNCVWESFRIGGQYGNIGNLIMWENVVGCWKLLDNSFQIIFGD